MKRIEVPDYQYAPCDIALADHRKMGRVWDLFGDFDTESHFNLACGIYAKTFVSGGTNERKNHAHRYPYREALHAEQVAIMSARTDISNTTLYVCRVSDDGHFRLAKPCFWCMHKIIDAKVSKVIYSTDEQTLIGFKVSTVQIDSINSLPTAFSQMVYS